MVGFGAIFIYHSISLSLNILLILMIIIRLLLHAKNLRNAIGASAGGTGLYTTIVTMIIKFHAIYAVCYLAWIIILVTDSPLVYIFFPLLAGSQVRVVSAFSSSRTLSDHGEMQTIAPFLIIIRVVGRRASTKDTINSGSGTLGSIRFRSKGESTEPSATVSEENPTTSTGLAERAPGGYGVEIEDVH